MWILGFPFVVLGLTFLGSGNVGTAIPFLSCVWVVNGCRRCGGSTQGAPDGSSGIEPPSEGGSGST